MKTFSDTLFNTVTKLSNHAGILANVADGILSQVASHRVAAAAGRCTWEYDGCCETSNETRYKKVCGGRTEWKCQGRCML